MGRVRSLDIAVTSRQQAEAVELVVVLYIPEPPLFAYACIARYRVVETGLQLGSIGQTSVAPSG